MKKKIVLKILILSFYLITLIIQKQLFAQVNGQLIWAGDPNQKKIAFTFDDGPRPEFAPELLNILERFNVKATFFVVGREVMWHPDLLTRIHYSGHEIGNHSFTHCRLDALDEKELEIELLATNEIIQSITGKKVKYIRPPGGRYNKHVLKIAAENGLKCIMWDVNAGDYARTTAPFEIKDENNLKQGEVFYKPTEKIVQDVLSRVQGGSIILFHNGGEGTVKALPQIIMKLKEAGYKMVTVSELLASSNLAKASRKLF